MHICKNVRSSSNNQMIYVYTIHLSLVPIQDGLPIRVKFFIPLNSKIFNKFLQQASTRIWQRGKQGPKKYCTKLFEDTREVNCTITSKIIFSITSVNLPSIHPLMKPQIGEIHVGPVVKYSIFVRHIPFCWVC